jgi:hypothetical protein
VNCSGNGVQVRWIPRDLPRAATYRLCVDGSCKPVRPRILYGDNAHTIAVVAPASERDVRVRLELFDASGREMTSFEGEGRRSGTCCPFVSFRPTSSGSLVVEKN